MTEARPATMKVYIRCTGKRKDGRLCDQLLAVLTTTGEFDGTLELACPKCHTRANFS